MVRYSKREPKPVVIKNRKLVCPVCGHDHFIETKAQMNTAAASLFDLDWVNKEAKCYVCADCTYVYWFRN